MKKLLLLLFFTGMTNAIAQTAANFTCNDCNGISHNLYSEIDAGNVAVICWVMPCAACVSGALTCNNVCQSFPNNVLFYLCDDYANTNCSSLNSWAAGYNITPTAFFSNSAINMTDYGSTGMPKVVVIGGPNHTVFYNANNTFDAFALQNAINTALSVTGINEKNLNVTSLNVFPNPAKDAASIKFNMKASSDVIIELFNLEGKKMQNIYSGKTSTGENEISLNLETIPAGIYLVKLTENGISQYSNVVVSH